MKSDIFQELSVRSSDRDRTASVLMNFLPIEGFSAIKPAFQGVPVWSKRLLPSRNRDLSTFKQGL